MRSGAHHALPDGFGDRLADLACRVDHLTELRHPLAIAAQALEISRQLRAMSRWLRS